MTRRLQFTVRNSTFALGVLPVAVLFVFSSCGQRADVAKKESQTIENALGMKFVPIKMTLPGKPSEVIYMQQAEVTYEQYRKFKVAVGLATTEAERTPSGAAIGAERL